jgi:hypothetical protein
MTIGYPRRCHWLNQNGVQCGMPLGHTTEHGNGLLTPGPNDWHEALTEGAPPPKVSTGEKFGVVHTDKSTVIQCLWMGAHGRCIYETGHTIGHKEETLHG